MRASVREQIIYTYIEKKVHIRIISTRDVHKRKRQISAKNRYLKNCK